MKEQILKSLETMSKAQLSKEIGISPFILNKFISSKMETIRTEYLDKVKAYYGEEDFLVKIPETRRVLAVMDAVRKSAETGKSVDFE